MPSSEPKATEITSISRVVYIPLVNGAVDFVLNAINWQYLITRSGHIAAQGISASLHNLAEPFRTHLAPVITYADGYTNKGIDLRPSSLPLSRPGPKTWLRMSRGRMITCRDWFMGNRKLNDISPADAVADGNDKVCLPLCLTCRLC
jgi:hypothetical protein